MSSIRTSNFRRSSPDHFEPEGALDHQAQRRLRGQLEQIDYTAFASNQEVIGHMVGLVDLAKFQRLAVAAAAARGQWVAEALSATESAHALSHEQVARLVHLRTSYEELAEVYEAMRRMVERGYLTMHQTAQG
ncbi:MAG: hypothetical protein P4L64_00545 [Caulobacteraceae bacterium]|nr:hypothetical protein [Caulobacteraceae bacterium]